MLYKLIETFCEDSICEAEQQIEEIIIIFFYQYSPICKFEVMGTRDFISKQGKFKVWIGRQMDVFPPPHPTPLRVPWMYQYWPGGFMLFVVLCPLTPKGSTGSGSGFKGSQKTGQQLKVL